MPNDNQRIAIPSNLLLLPNYNALSIRLLTLLPHNPPINNPRHLIMFHLHMHRNPHALLSKVITIRRTLLRNKK